MLSVIVASTDDDVYRTTIGSIITNWNAGAEKMYGYSAKEMIGKSVTSIFPPEIIDEESAVLQRVQKGEAFNIKTKRRTKDGKILDISLTVSPIIGPDGTLSGVSRIARDISDEKRLFEEVRESEARFRIVADSAPVLIWMTDTSANCN